TLPLNCGSTGGGVTVLLSEVPGGEKTPPASFLPGCPPPAWACSSAACALGPPKPVRYAAIPSPRHVPRQRYSSTSHLRLMVRGSLRNCEMVPGDRLVLKTCLYAAAERRC